MDFGQSCSDTVDLTRRRVAEIMTAEKFFDEHRHAAFRHTYASALTSRDESVHRETVSSRVLNSRSQRDCRLEVMVVEKREYVVPFGIMDYK